MRREMRSRQRRIIYNDDGCGPLWAKEGGNTPEHFLHGPHSRMGAVLGTQVDSVFIFDNGVIEQVQDITRVWHCPEKQQGPLIKSDQPWEDVTYFSCNTWNAIAPRTVALVRGPELGMKPTSLRVGDGAGGLDMAAGGVSIPPRAGFHADALRAGGLLI